MLLWRAGVRARWSAATPPAVHRGTRGGGVRIHTYSHHHYRNSGGSSSSNCYAMQTLRRRVVLHTGSTRLHGVRGIHTTASPLAGRLNAQQQAKRDRAKHWLRHQSKKAKKRYRKRMSEVKRTTRPSASSELAVYSKDDLATLAPERMEETINKHRVLMEAIMTEVPQPPSAKEELRAIDTAELFEALRTGALRRTQESISLLFRAYAEQKQFDEAMQLVQLVEQSGGELQSQDYTSLLTLCGNVNNPGAAEQLIDLMRHRGLQPSVVHKSVLMRAHVKNDDLEQARETLVAMVRDGLKPDAATFTNLIVGCNHAGKYDQAFQVFDYMRTHFTEPDLVTYTAIIQTCGKCDEVERALNMFTEMKHNGIEPDHVAFNCMIATAARSFRMFEEAETLYHEMRSNALKPDDKVYASLILACSHEGNVNKAKRWMHTMYSEGVAPTPRVFANLLTVYMRSMTKISGKPRDLTMLEKMDGRSLLQPWEPPKDRGRIGDGGIAVDADDEDTVANKLLMDYFNSDLKRNYEADATDSDPDEMDSEEEKQMINDAAFEEGMKADVGNMLRQLGKVPDTVQLSPEQMKLYQEAQTVEEGTDIMKLVFKATADDTELELDDDNVDRLLGDTDWEQLDEEELERRYERYTRRLDALENQDDKQVVMRTLPTLKQLESGEVTAETVLNDPTTLIGRTLATDAKQLEELQQYMLSGGVGPMPAALEGAEEQGAFEEPELRRQITAGAGGDGEGPGPDVASVDPAAAAATDGEASESDSYSHAAAAVEATPVYSTASGGGSSGVWAGGSGSGSGGSGSGSVEAQYDVLVTDGLTEASADSLPESNAVSLFQMSPAAVAATADMSKVPRGPGSSPGVNVEAALVAAWRGDASGPEALIANTTKREAFPHRYRVEAGADGLLENSGEPADVPGRPSTLRVLLAAHQLGQQGRLDGDPDDVAPEDTMLAPALEPGTEAELRLRTLRDVSGEMLRGATWLPVERDADPNRARNALLREMHNVYKYMQREHDVQPDDVMATIMVGALTLSMREQEAYRFLRTEFPRLGVQPQVATYRHLMRMHMRKREVDRMQELKTEMLEAGVKPCKDCMGMIVHGYAAKRNVAGALAVLEEMNDMRLECPEHWAFHLREVCKQLEVYHPLVPDHPLRSEFAPKANLKRRTNTRVSRKIQNEMKAKRTGSFMSF